MDYKAAKAYIIDKLENELSETLTYHGMHHTLDVLKVTEELCDIENVEGRDKILLLTAALFHDAGFTVDSKNHEELGCLIVKSTLPKYGYTDTDILKICGMIMATKIPQRPRNHLEKIICDADLDYLGREDFYSIGNSLYKELNTLNVISDKQTWNRIQVNFLKSHHFHTNTNKNRRTPVKQMYLEELKEIVAGYES